MIDEKEIKELDDLIRKTDVANQRRKPLRILGVAIFYVACFFIVLWNYGDKNSVDCFVYSAVLGIGFAFVNVLLFTALFDAVKNEDGRLNYLTEQRDKLIAEYRKQQEKENSKTK